MELSEILRLLSALAVLPFYLLTIWFETKFPRLNIFMRFPRNGVEIFADKKRFFEILKQGEGVPTDFAAVVHRRCRHRFLHSQAISPPTPSLSAWRGLATSRTSR
jgi:hypothetical protein